MSNDGTNSIPAPSNSPPHVLFVSSNDRWRSPTAERIYRRDTRLEVRAGGMEDGAKNKISKADVKWADVILVMESKHRDRLLRQYRDLDGDAVIVLHIQDEFKYMDSNLVDLLHSTVEPIFESIGLPPK